MVSFLQNIENVQCTYNGQLSLEYCHCTVSVKWQSLCRTLLKLYNTRQMVRLLQKTVIYFSEHIFCQHRGTGIPAAEAITFGSYIVMRNCNVLYCVQHTLF